MTIESTRATEAQPEPCLLCANNHGRGCWAHKQPAPATGGEPVPASTGREVVAPMTVADLMRIVRANWGDDAAIERAFRANLAARELDVEAERRHFDWWAVRERVPYCDTPADRAQQWIGWQARARSAAQGSAPAPDAYRLLDTRDTIEATDEWLGNDAVTWAVNPYRLFDGSPYCEAMLPARRRVAPSNNSPASAKEQE